MFLSADTTERKSPMHLLALGALGIVFGDIGTSPLYAVQECFAHGLTPEPDNILGVISLIFWSITMVVSLKYCFIMMRAGNKGEGGILALMALARSGGRHKRQGLSGIMLIGLCGAALFFGDSMITPAISVLSAVEGLNIAAPQMHEFILPITVMILVLLFLFQSQGTQRVGAYFGPIMVLWFFVIGIVGLRAIIQEPQILAAVNPYYALKLVTTHGWLAFSVMGAALLCFTGAEALYADMGHFGPKPIRYAWFGLVMPGLMLNYFGQGALLIAKPEAASNPFYLMVPSEFTLSMVGLAALATVIASQAMISATFSVVQQAMQLDFLPRFTVRHTSAREYGQIYIPQINWLLCAAVVLLVILFRSSGALANAYGFAVVGTILAGSILVYSVMRNVWHWSRALSVLVIAPFLVVDTTFFATAAAKIPDGGWLPLCIGLVIFTVFITWRQGRDIIRANRHTRSRQLEAFIASVKPEAPLRVSGTAVYLSSIRGLMSPAMASNLRHNKVLHERVIALTLVTEGEPRVPDEHRVTITTLGKGFWQVVLHYGFMERPDLINDLQTYLLADCPFDMKETSFFIGHDIFVEGEHAMRPQWRKQLFLWLANHAEDASSYFRIPTEHVVKLGVQIEV